MPLKGVLLHRVLYDDPVRRPITDVDLLISPGGFSVAIHAMAAAGHRYRSTARSRVAKSFFAPSRLVLDIHWDPFAPGRYRMHAADLFERGRRDDRLFGARVVLPSNLDLYLHTIGKFAADTRTEREAHLVWELSAIPERLGLGVRDVVDGLLEFGMARAARYAFSYVSDAFTRAVLAGLPEDRVGHGLALLARAAARGTGSRSPLSTVGSHLLNRTGSAAAIAMVKATRTRVMTRLGRGDVVH
jgi:hypothetical protein